jgi:hypothetical protein
MCFRFKKILAKTDGADAAMTKSQNVDMFFTELLERAHEDSKRNLKKLERRLYDHLRSVERRRIIKHSKVPVLTSSSLLSSAASTTIFVS